ncbi:hypothetical protein BGZ61DRAFT_532698 [Ilyonectria robusta]|uniref:uncharacterized protein n=1 Tax=Ilyonectria robusta TaxID=1079257 RepID=UPI001E8D44CB|nr:uncharacterized protein BGZ61DRAFT_532698 [Ilyonectria robusta]KAH8694647.1 hypothetical protein BGZ61DRAFT_532698 [Ilyonectria robusta]
MKHHGLIVLVLGAYVRLGTSTPQQTSSQRTSAVSNPLGPTARPRELANARRQDGSGDTCGFVSDIPVTCVAGPCGFLSVLGGTRGYMGCCNDDGCSFQTDCIEGGTASDTKTLACIGELSFCATYTWPDYEAAAYYCATSRSTDTVTTMDPDFSSTIDLELTSTYGGQTDDTDASSGSRQNTGAPQPTFTASGKPTGAIPTDAGTPELPVYADWGGRWLRSIWTLAAWILCGIWVLEGTEADIETNIEACTAARKSKPGLPDTHRYL